MMVFRQETQKFPCFILGQPLLPSQGSQWKYMHREQWLSNEQSFIPFVYSTLKVPYWKYGQIIILAQTIHIALYPTLGVGVGEEE